MARQLLSQHPVPDFYRLFTHAHSLSRRLFDTDPLVAALRRPVAVELEDDFGHGMRHSISVSLDAGALMAIEGPRAGFTPEHLHRRICLAHCAGLLHDTQRKHRNHARAGAKWARGALDRFDVTASEVEDICLAIGNHEAFQPVRPIVATEGALLSDCLYDADKFRWGPDNFSDTLWQMVSFRRIPIARFIDGYPQGMAGLERIRGTFRTLTGKAYGPQFIDIGIAVGRQLFEAIVAEKGGPA